MSQVLPVFPVSLPQAELHAHSQQEHAVRFYSDEPAFLDELSGFIETVLRSGRAFVVIATSDHCKTISRKLDNKAGGLHREACLFLDANIMLARIMLEGEPSAKLFRELMSEALAKARHLSLRQQVTAFGEMVAVLWLKGKKQAALWLEKLWNELAETETFSLLCAYPAHLFQDPQLSDDFMRVCATHSTVLPDESYTVLRSDAERLRAIAALQQKVRVLDAEVAEHKRMESDLESLVRARTREIEQSRNHLQDLSCKLTRLRDEERRSIGQQLHDGIAQLLAVLAMYVDRLSRSKQDLSGGSEQLLTRSHVLIQRILQEVRALSYGLYPPTLDILGLPAALEWCVACFIERTGIQVALEINRALGRLPGEIEHGIYQLVQDWLAQVRQELNRRQRRIELSCGGAFVELNLWEASCEDNSSALSSTLPITGEMLEKVRELGGRAQLISASGRRGFAFFFPADNDEQLTA